MSVIRALAAALLLSAASCAGAPASSTIGDVRVVTFDRADTNAHLVVQGANAILIDTGNAADAEALEAGIRAAGVDPETLRAIILTHGHADHAGASMHFHQRYGTPIVAGAGDTDHLALGSNDTLCPVGMIARMRLKSDQAAVFPAVTETLPVSAPMALEDIAGIRGRIVPLPGHTPGSVVVIVGEAAFVGDLFRGGVISRTKGATHFYMCDLDENRADIESLLTDIAPDATAFYTGHFGPVPREEAVKLSSAGR